MINVNENLRQRGIDPMPDLRERPAFDSDDEPAPAPLVRYFDLAGDGELTEDRS